MKRDDLPIHLLLIEDNPGDALLVEEYVSEVFEKAEITAAETFKEAKTLLESDSEYTTILLDLSLPDAEGMNLVDEVLKLSVSVPVIILTGYSNLEFSMKSLSKGISDYLLKDELSPTLLHKSIIYSIERNVFSSRLKESEKNYKELFELSPQPLMLFELDTFRFLEVNKAAVAKYGYSKEEFLKMTLMDIKPEQEVEESKKAISNTKDQIHVTFDKDYRHITKSGKEILVEIHASTVDYEGKKVRMALAHDVTQKRKEEERLKLLESVVTHAKEFMVILEAEPFKGQERKILFVNKAFTEITGYTEDEVLGESLYFLNGEKTDMKEIEKLNKAMKNWEISSLEYINYKKDGTPFWVNTSIVPVGDKEGGFSHWVVIGREINERKRYEKELQESLKEKDILLNEIHHRVKNNLAIVSGLMQLQAYDEDNKEVEIKLMDSVLRIRTMASIHELLYESESFSQVNFSNMIQKLVEETTSAMESDKKIKIDLNQEDIELNINQAIPCALMINEVLTNAYKHAFKEREEGVIGIQIGKSKGKVDVMVKDDGVGLEKSDKKTLGLQLIEILTRQLEGEYSYAGNSNGTLFTLNFNKKEVKGSANTLGM